MQNSHQMGSMIGVCFPIWIPSNSVNGQNTYFGNLEIFPSYFSPLINHVQHAQFAPQRNQDAKGQNFQEIKQSLAQQHIANEKEFTETQKKSVSMRQGQKPKTEKHKGLPKSKRPLKYLTQKSFYMKQKLKGKMKSNQRILRKRNSDNQNNCIKNKLRTSNIKEKVKENHQTKKKHKVIKKQEKQKKTYKKLKLKNPLEPYDSFAEIPPLISGVRQINEFVLKKLQNLRLKQVGRK